VAKSKDTSKEIDDAADDAAEILDSELDGTSERSEADSDDTTYEVESLEGEQAPDEDLAENLDDDLSAEAEDDLDDQDPEGIAVGEPHPGMEPAPVVQQTVVRKGGFWPLLLGGVAAACLGFFAADPERLPASFQQFIPAFMMPQSDGTAEALAAQAAEIDALKAQLANLPTFDPSALEAGLSGVSDTVAGVSAQVTAVEDRIVTLEKRPLAAAVSEEAIAAYENELEELKADLRARSEELRSTAADAAQEIETVKNAATEQAERAAFLEQLAASKAALGKISAALDIGGAFDTEFNTLSANSPVDVPDVLGTAAADGVATLASLQAGFPEAAREALSADRAAGGTSEGTNRLMAFLAKQTGARSVTPRDGDDADAVLSRAEAAAKSGDLTAALGELDGLTDAAASAVADWRAAAQLRIETTAAAAALNSQLNEL